MGTRRHGAASPASGVSRRDVLRGGAAAAAVVASGAATALAAQDTRKAAETGAVAVPAFELEEATLAELQRAMEGGRHTARSLVEAYLARIEAVDRVGPTLRAVIEINPDAAAIAARLDEERRQNGPRGPLHGVPVLIKDNVATGDAMETTAGSLALVGAATARDSFLAARLRAAGAVILGKTNLSEWANFRSSHSSSGWSARGGQCANPYVLDRNPCGSSSGTGAAIAASLAAVGIGTETDGSIVCPSHACSLVGVKPTVGLVSRSGIVPIAHSQDTAGPMARTVADAALLLAAIAGRDATDTATGAAPAEIPDYASLLDPHALRGARIGVPRKAFFGYSDEADAVIEEALEVLRREGATVVDPVELPHAGEYDGAELEVLLYEFKADLGAYLAAWAPEAQVRSLAELIAFNERHRESEMPYFGQDLLERAEAKGPLTEAEYRKALDTCRALAREKGLDALFAKQRLDAVVGPTGSPAWPTDLVNGDHFLGAASTPAAVSGYPTVTVPAGYSFGLPVGLTFVGRAWGEAGLLRLAFAFEQATRHRRPPRFLRTLQL